MSVSSMGPPLLQCLPQLSGQWLIYIQSPAPSPPLLPQRPTSPPSPNTYLPAHQASQPPANTLGDALTNNRTNISRTTNTTTIRKHFSAYLARIFTIACTNFLCTSIQALFPDQTFPGVRDANNRCDGKSISIVHCGKNKASGG